LDRETLLRYGALGAGALVVIAVGVAAFNSLQSPYQPPIATSTQTSAPCSPQPCANIRGYQLWVTDLSTDSGLVTMMLTFRNSSSATHADPSDLQLIDSAGHPNQPIHDAPGCTAWPRTDFNHGAQFGPVPECFRPASTGPPLKLHWDPDFGFFCCETEITLAA
jgi:hypothetical protein